MRDLGSMRSLAELQDMAEMVVLIVGGAGYLGSTMADALAEAGAKIAIVDRNEEVGNKVCRQIKLRHDTEAVFFEGEISDDKFP